MRRTIAGFLLGLCLASSLVAVQRARAEAPDATMDVRGWIVAAGVGFSKLEGDVTFQGLTYPVTVLGTSALAAGGAYLCGSAQVFGLQRIEDLNARLNGGIFGASFVAGGHGGRWAGDGLGIEAQLHAWGLDVAGGFERIRVIVHQRDGRPMGRDYWPEPSARR